MPEEREEVFASALRLVTRGLGYREVAKEAVLSRESVRTWLNGEGLPSRGSLDKLYKRYGEPARGLYALAGFTPPEGPAPPVEAPVVPFTASRDDEQDRKIEELRQDMNRVLGILRGFTDLLKAQRKE